MTDQAVIEDARHEQLLAESVPSPDIRLPLATVEPEQRVDPVAEATAAGNRLLSVLGPAPRKTRR